MTETSRVSKLPRPEVHRLLDQLFAVLEIDTLRWTYARTPFLYAVATPTERSESHCDVLIRIQPSDPEVEDIGGWAVRVKETRPVISAEIEDGGRIHLVALTEGRHRLQAFKPEAMLPMSIRGRLRGQLAAANQQCGDSARLAAAPELLRGGMRAELHRVLRWQSPDGLLVIDGAVNAAGDATIWLRSSDVQLDGLPIVLRVGQSERRMVLSLIGRNVEGEARLTSDEWRQAQDGLAFRVDSTEVLGASDDSRR